MKASRSNPLPFSRLQVDCRPFDLPAENWRWSGSLPNCGNLRVALQGQAEMTARGKTYPLHARACFVFSPTQELSVRSGAPLPFRNFACRLLPAEGNGDKRREKVGRLMGPEAANFFGRRDFGPAALPASRLEDSLAAQQTTGLSAQCLAQVWPEVHPPAPARPGGWGGNGGVRPKTLRRNVEHGLIPDDIGPTRGLLTHHDHCDAGEDFDPSSVGDSASAVSRPGELGRWNPNLNS